MKAERFGSYSRRSILPTTSNLRRLKSIMRYRRLAPPPRKRTAMRPPPPRPPDLVRPSTRDFSGRPLWSSDLSTSTSWRRPGEVGLYCFKAIGSEPRGDVDRLAFGQGHDSFLDVGTPALDAAEPLGLALDVQGVDLGHVHFEQRLDGGCDFVLRRIARDPEDHLVVLGEQRGLFRDDRGQDGVVVTGGGLLGHYAASFSWKRALIASTASLVSTRVRRRSTS